MNIDYNNPYNPAIATHPKNTRDTYQFIHTESVLSTLQDKGWQVNQLSIAKSRKYSGYQKHLVRLQHPSLPSTTDGRPEIDIINSHIGNSALYLLLGYWRNCCANGLIVGTGYFFASIRHQGLHIPSRVTEASTKLLEAAPVLTHEIELMQNTQLTDDQRFAFAKTAQDLRWKDEYKPVQTIELLKTRRGEDNGSSVWQVYNTIQENVLKGGIAATNLNSRRYHTRTIKAVDVTTKINRSLFDVARGYIQ